MDLQKKRSSIKKGKQTKTQSARQIPLAPLMMQINQLKSQLASIKSKKSLKSTKQLDIVTENQLNATQSNLNSPKSELKGDKTLEKLYIQDKPKEKLKQIMFPIRENEIKMNYQLNKLYDVLKEKEDMKTIHNLGKLVDCINSGIREFQVQNRKILTFEDKQPSFSWKQKVRVYQQFNNELQKHHLAKQIDELEALSYYNQNIKQQYEILTKSIAGLESQLEKSKIICEGLREQRRQLEEKIRIYQRSIQKKQSQILMYEQDISFTRMQTDKHKVHKREIEKILQSLQKDYKQLKSKYQIDTEALIKERNKWRNQCQLRRTNEQQILGQQQQKTHLKKQIQTSRKQLTNLIEQLQSVKQRLCAEQKKNLTLQQKQFKLETQNERLARNLEYCRLEMKEMTVEVQQVRDQAHKYRDMAVKNKLTVKNTGKAQALQQIQEMIRMHRKVEEDQQ